MKSVPIDNTAKSGDIVGMKAKAFIELPQKAYFGGKGGSGTYQTIINQIPKHQTYVSGFLGLDAVLRIKKPARFNIGIELNEKVVEIWKAARFPNKDIAPPNLTVLQKSFFEVDLPCFYNRSTFFYLDPPYTWEERKSNNRYDFELSLAEHEKMLVRVMELPCMIAISCYDNDLYRKYLKDWRKIQFDVITRGGTMATETLYMNYAAVPPSELHDTRFLGMDYRKREVTKKRLTTLLGKIARLEDYEKAMLFEELKSNYPFQFSLDHTTNINVA